MNIIVFIPARGGSKGIPNKNIMRFAGKPLIVYSIEYAQESKLIDKLTNDAFSLTNEEWKDVHELMKPLKGVYFSNRISRDKDGNPLRSVPTYFKYSQYSSSFNLLYNL